MGTINEVDIQHMTKEDQVQSYLETQLGLMHRTISELEDRIAKIEDRIGINEDYANEMLQKMLERKPSDVEKY